MRLSTTIFIWTWLMAGFSMGTTILMVGSCFNFPSYLDAATGYVVCFLMWLLLKLRSSKLVREQIAQCLRLTRHCHIVRVGLGISGIVFQCTLATLTVPLGVCITLWYGGVAGSLVAYQTGSYELGERIFAITPAPSWYKGDISIAANWDGQKDANGLYHCNSELTSIISRIYGANSIQLAHRFELLGERERIMGFHAMERNEKFIGKSHFAESACWYKNAFKLFQQSGNFQKSVQCIGYVAYSHVKQDKPTEARLALNNTLQMIYSRNERNNFADTIELMAIVAHYLNDDTQSDYLYKQYDEIKTCNRRM